jgi:hypothetical protein
MIERARETHLRERERKKMLFEQVSGFLGEQTGERKGL